MKRKSKVKLIILICLIVIFTLLLYKFAGPVDKEKETERIIELMVPTGKINITDDPLDKNIEKAQIMDALEHGKEFDSGPEEDSIDLDEILIKEDK